MKRVIRSSSRSGRPTKATKDWAVINISVEVFLHDIKIASSTNSQNAIDDFFDKIVELLGEHDYFPYLSVPLMKRKLHSPYSNSEYYTFLKIEDDEKVKLILDIRFSDHDLSNRNGESAKSRHLNYMRDKVKLEVAEELGYDTEDSQLEFYDIRTKYSPIFEIDIDNQQAFSIEEALRILSTKVANLERK